MAKQIRAARHYRERVTPLRQIADGSKLAIARDIRDALKHLPELLPRDAAEYARRVDWHGLVDAIDWNHFRGVLKATFASIGRAREAAAQHGAQQINQAFASAKKPVRYRKTYNPDEPRDEHGRWTSEGGAGLEDKIGQTVWADKQTVYRVVPEHVASGREAFSSIDGKGIFVFTRRSDAQEYKRTGGGRIFVATMDAHDQGIVGDFDIELMHAHQLSNDMPRSFANAGDTELYEPRTQVYVRDPSLLHSFSRIGKSDESVAKVVTDQYSFDIYDEDTQASLRQMQDALIAQLEDEARDAIEQIVGQGAIDGSSPEEILDDIRDWIGLTARQAQAVSNYRSMLENLDPDALQRQLRNVLEDEGVANAIENDDPLDSDYIDKLVQDYQDNYLDYRASTIADTEGTRAVNAGLQDSYMQAIDRGVFPYEAVKQFWKVDLDEATCPVCLSIPDRNPDGVAIDESFDSIDGPQDAPPVHPNCRCDVQIVTDLDMLPDDDSESDDEEEG